MKKILILVASFFAVALASADFKPAIVYGMGEKFDKNYNEGAYNAFERFKKETGIPYREAQIGSMAEAQQFIEKMAKRGQTPIIAMGNAFISGIQAVSKKYPNISFAVVGYDANDPQTQSILFDNHTGSFLVGMLAAMKSETNTIGFVGGMDIPPIRDFFCGYEQGAKYYNKDTKVLASYAGIDASAWSNPTRGAELTKAQMEQGADVVYAVSGLTNVGVFQATKDAGKYSIGVTSNQNYLFPGTILTSMVASTDVAVYEALKEAQNGTFKYGIKTIGLESGGIDWALDEYNRSLVTPKMEQAINQAKQDIIDGKIKVVSYLTNNNCDY